MYLRLLVALGLASEYDVLAQDLFLAARPSRPNLVWFLTDDQDQMLGASFPTMSNGATPMAKTKRLLQDAGATATNWYIHTPICSPSRSELLTGRYFHNIREIGPMEHSYCDGMHVNYTLVNSRNFAGILKDEGGYATGMFGKYVNEMPKTPPAGFDAWFANGGGDYIAPSFQVKNVDGLPDGQVHFNSDPENYTTALVGNLSIAWIKKVAKTGKPFMAYIAPKAAHEPFNPAPWYRDAWDPSWPDQEPRPENWNCTAESRQDHHGNIRTQPMLTDRAAKVITGVFKNRWRTLMSVDDVISEVIQTVEQLGMLDNTYFFYSSDHGFQLGQFNIPMDKRHVYEWDTKIHLLVRGPGIEPGSTFSAPGTQVDIAPTLLGLAGLKDPSMDGRSIVPFLVGERRQEDLASSTLDHLMKLGDLEAYRKNWRQEVFIEYYFCDPNIKCIDDDCPTDGNNYPHMDSNCANLADNSDCWCTSKRQGPTCYPTETTANNFIALRSLREGDNSLYAKFQTGDLGVSALNFDKFSFEEYYDVAKDPWQMRNLIAQGVRPSSRTVDSLERWFQCSGSLCP